MLISTHRPYEMWIEGCVKEIPNAKARLREFLRLLCDDQQAANDAYHGTIRGGGGACRGTISGCTVDSANNPHSEFVGAAATNATTTNTTTTHTDHTTSTTNTSATYGVIYTGEPKHFRLIHQSITSLILSNSTQSIHTVEVWVNYYAHTECMRIFSKFAVVRCMVFRSGSGVQVHSMSSTSSGSGKSVASSATNTSTTTSTTTTTTTTVNHVVIRGFESKLHALLQTTLHHVLFLDADNVVSRDVSEVFRNPGYIRTGMCFILCNCLLRLTQSALFDVLYILWLLEYSQM